MEMTLGEKLKSARKSAGLTQEQLAEKLLVSRQAITKWESDRGMPDVENLKSLSQLLGVSIDYLLDNGEHLDLSVIREEINLDEFTYERKLSGRWSKKTGKKDMVEETSIQTQRYITLWESSLRRKAKKSLIM